MIVRLCTMVRVDCSGREVESGSKTLIDYKLGSARIKLYLSMAICRDITLR